MSAIPSLPLPDRGRVLVDRNAGLLSSKGAGAMIRRLPDAGRFESLNTGESWEDGPSNVRVAQGKQ